MLKYFLLVVIGCLLLAYIGCSLDSRVAKANAKYMKRAPFDAIIVPGFPYLQVKDEILFNVRMNFAKELYEKGIAKNIIFSGAAVHSPYIEGKIMKIIADSLGIPANHTFVEDKALHSNENAINGTRLAHKLGFKNIAVATDPYQFAYMVYLLKFYTSSTAIISFFTNQMPVDMQPMPRVDTTQAYVKNFVPID